MLYVRPEAIATERRGGGLYDYKIHCFNGEPLFIQCIGDRDLRNHQGYQKNYDLQWKVLDWSFETYPRFSYDVPRPQHLNELVECARKLSAGLKYVRTDFYEINGQVYFGEMTFYPLGGLYRYRGSWTQARDLELGARIDLTEQTK